LVGTCPKETWQQACCAVDTKLIGDGMMSELTKGNVSCTKCEGRKWFVFVDTIEGVFTLECDACGNIAKMQVGEFFADFEDEA
jgi:hypothetical protein